jgi:hypothetical protein
LFSQQNTIGPLKLQLFIVLSDDKNYWDLLVLHKICSHFDIIGHIDVGRCKIRLLMSKTNATVTANEAEWILMLTNS